jgi:hypothetical protein
MSTKIKGEGWYYVYMMVHLMPSCSVLASNSLAIQFPLLNHKQKCAPGVIKDGMAASHMVEAEGVNILTLLL